LQLGGRDRHETTEKVFKWHNASHPVLVNAASMSEKAGALLILGKMLVNSHGVVKIFADGGYEGKDFAQKVKDDHQLDLEVVKRKQSKGFQVLPWRWIMERTLAWIVRHRRLTIDYEALPATT
jgi:transposase